VLLEGAVQVADLGVHVDDLLALQLEHEAHDAVHGGCAGPMFSMYVFWLRSVVSLIIRP